MTTTAFYNTCTMQFRHPSPIISAVTGMLLCFFAQISHAQVISIMGASGNQTYRLPDTATLKTTAGVQAAITTVEAAGKALTASAAVEKAVEAAQGNVLNKSKATESDYVTAVTAFSKNDVAPYKADLDAYTAAGTKFTTALSNYNKAVIANNALPAKSRKAATVALLNKQKAHIDSSVTQLSNWKVKLDKAKAKLDVKNGTLLKQKTAYETAGQMAATKIKASGVKLKSIADQLSLCEKYAAQCHKLLVDKFGGTDDAGYFSTTDYKNTKADLNTSIEKLTAMQ